MNLKNIYTAVTVILYKVIAAVNTEHFLADLNSFGQLTTYTKTSIVYALVIDVAKTKCKKHLSLIRSLRCNCAEVLKSRCVEPNLLPHRSIYTTAVYKCLSIICTSSYDTRYKKNH